MIFSKSMLFVRFLFHQGYGAALERPVLKQKAAPESTDAALFLMAEGLFVFFFLLVSLQQLLLNIGRYLLVLGHLHGEGSAS